MRMNPQDKTAEDALYRLIIYTKNGSSIYNNALL